MSGGEGGRKHGKKYICDNPGRAEKNGFFHQSTLKQSQKNAWIPFQFNSCLFYIKFPDFRDLLSPSLVGTHDPVKFANKQVTTKQVLIANREKHALNSGRKPMPPGLCIYVIIRCSP